MILSGLGVYRAEGLSAVGLLLWNIVAFVVLLLFILLSRGIYLKKKTALIIGFVLLPIWSQVIMFTVFPTGQWIWFGAAICLFIFIIAVYVRELKRYTR
jgi:hypothetical protein